MDIERHRDRYLEGRRDREMQERCRIEMGQRSRESEIQTAKMAGDKWQK